MHSALHVPADNYRQPLPLYLEVAIQQEMPQVPHMQSTPTYRKSVSCFYMAYMEFMAGKCGSRSTNRIKKA